MLKRLSHWILPPPGPAVDHHNARVLGGVLAVAIILGVTFDTFLFIQSEQRPWEPLKPKAALYTLLATMFIANRLGHYRLAANGALLSGALFGASMFYFGSLYEPAICAMLVFMVAGILLGPVEGLLHILFSLVLWSAYGRWGDLLFSKQVKPVVPFSNHALDLVLYGLVALALQSVLRHFLLQTMSRLEAARHLAEVGLQAKSRFFAQMSHELRTPVAGVIGLLGLTLKRELPAEARTEIEQALRQAEAQLDLINDVLDLAKVEAGRLSLECIAFDPRTLLSEGLYALHQTALGKGLAFSWKVEENVPAWLEGDPLRLRQILLNLASNAVKFTTSGSIQVAFEAKPDLFTGKGGIRLTVTDTGPGISTEAQGRLFMAFEQGETSTTRHFGGTGLGLSITHNLVLAMGGTLSVNSLVGRGSAFTADLPLVASEPPKVVAPAEAPQELHYRLRILLVEDIPTNRYIALHMLKALGQTVDWAEDGAEACRKLSEIRYDLVFMDMLMPVMDGIDASQCIRRGGFPDTPVLDTEVEIIALTANAGEADRQACLDAGMSGFLTKPLRSSDLRRELIQTATRQRLRGFILPPLNETGDSGWTAVPSESEKANAEDSSLSTALAKLWPKEAEKRLSALSLAQSNRNRESLAREAHNIKGSAGYLKLPQLVALASRLESAADETGAHGATWTELEVLKAAVESAIAESLKEMEALT